MSTSRDNILQRLKDARDRRKAVTPEQPDMVAPIYVVPDKDLAGTFREKLELVSGIFLQAESLDAAAGLVKSIAEEEKWDSVFCLDGKIRNALEGKVPYKASADDFEILQSGVTPCEFLIAHLGSVMVSSGEASGRRLHVFPETHLVIAHTGQLVMYLDEALTRLQDKYKRGLPSMITNITGPSRTADIEKTLVKGMHGPRKLIVILCNQPF